MAVRQPGWVRHDVPRAENPAMWRAGKRPDLAVSHFVNNIISDILMEVNRV